MILTRNAIKLSLWMYVLFLVGIFGGALGPTLLDLKHLFQVSLLETSNLFLVHGIAEGAGCLGSVFLLKFLDSNLVLTACMLLQGASVLLFAMTPHLNIACVAVGGIGVATACALNCVVYQCNLIFPGTTAIMHGVFISSSVGGIVGPLIAGPFLEGGEMAYLHLPENDTLHESIFSNQSIYNSIAGIPLITNISTPMIMDNASHQHDSTTASKYISTNSTRNTKKSQVYIVYIIIGSVHLPAFLGFIMLFICERNSDLYQSNEVTSSDYKHIEAGQEPSGGLKTIIFYICLVFAYIPFGGLPFAYSGYLSVYGVESYLHLSSWSMAAMTSAFWMLFTLGRILGTILSLHIRQSVLIYICLTGVLVASVALLFLNQLGEVLLWIGSMAIGIFTGPLLAASLAWCRTCVTLTPAVIGICTFGDLTGVYLLQYFTGQVIGHLGLYWYLYFITSLALFEFMIFVILTVMSYYVE